MNESELSNISLSVLAGRFLTVRLHSLPSSFSWSILRDIRFNQLQMSIWPIIVFISDYSHVKQRESSWFPLRENFLFCQMAKLTVLYEGQDRKFRQGENQQIPRSSTNYFGVGWNQVCHPWTKQLSCKQLKREFCDMCRAIVPHKWEANDKI